MWANEFAATVVATFAAECLPELDPWLVCDKKTHVYTYCVYIYVCVCMSGLLRPQLDIEFRFAMLGRQSLFVLYAPQ
jgi:hypothetical protein